MAHNVTSMFSARQVPWHGLGTIVEESLTSASALKEAGLDWKVEQRPLHYFHDNTARFAEGWMTNIRSDNGDVLGVVTDRYKVVQNTEAFEFVDTLLGYDVMYETAGCLGGGKSVWLLAKLPEMYMVGDIVEPYLVFTTSHDGKNAIRAAITPIRVVCQNTLNLALSRSKRSWSIRHMGNIKGKMSEAQMTLGLANQYMLDLSTAANTLVNQKIDKKYVQQAVEFLFPIEDDDSDRRKANQVEAQEDIVWRLYNAPDLANVNDTKWGFINAITDSNAHKEPARATETYWENMFTNIINGPALVDKAYEYITVR